jgi:hypothetical protein
MPDVFGNMMNEQKPIDRNQSFVQNLLRVTDI